VRHDAWRMAGGRLTGILLAAAVWGPGAGAWAQDVEVTAALKITEGIVRPGAYAPVTFEATNRTGRAIAQVRVKTGGPFDVEAAWRLAPGESGERVLPIFCAGDNLALVVEFLDAGGVCVARTRVAPTEIQRLPYETALVAIQQGLPEEEQGLGNGLLSAIGAKQQRVLRLGREAMILVSRCFMLDAMISDDGVPAFAGLTIHIAPGKGRSTVSLPPVSPRVSWTVQPATYSFLGSKAWPRTDRLRLWLWLGLFGLGVLAVGVLVPGGHRAAAALALVVLAAAATVGLYLFGDVQLARVREARIFYMPVGAEHAALEHLALLESRGGAVAQATAPAPGSHRADGVADTDRPTAQMSPLPLPVLATSDEVFRTQGTLLYADVAGFRSSRAQTVVHSLLTEPRPFGYVVAQLDLAELGKMRQRPDLVEALLIQGANATGRDGKTRPLNAWAAQWKGDPGREVAYAGRSLAWWDRERRAGDGPFILAWWRDRPAEAVPGSPAPERLPALVVYGRRAPPE